MPDFWLALGGVGSSNWTVMTHCSITKKEMNLLSLFCEQSQPNTFHLQGVWKWYERFTKILINLSYIWARCDLYIESFLITDAGLVLWSERHHFPDIYWIHLRANSAAPVSVFHVIASSKRKGACANTWYSWPYWSCSSSRGVLGLVTGHRRQNRKSYSVLEALVNDWLLYSGRDRTSQNQI